MSDSDQLRDNVRALIAGVSQKDQFDGLALHAIVRAADEDGVARVRDVAANYRNDYIHALRAKGVDADREAGRLGQDEVRAYLHAHPEMRKATYHIPHDGTATGTAAKLVLHVAAKIGRPACTQGSREGGGAPFPKEDKS